MYPKRCKQQEDINARHVFPIGSVSKTITSACIVSMVDDELLSLEDSIGTWISGFEHIDGSIKVFQLLNHTSGIYNYTDHPNWAPTINSTLSTTYTMAQMVEGFVNEPNFVPGTDWSYSNTNYLLLGIIIESITQKEYYEAVRERVLSPNGLDNIVLLPHEQPSGPLAHVWQGNPPFDLQANGIPLTAIYSSASAAGAYAGTPSDISEWGRKLYTGEILGTATDLLFDYDVPFGNASYGLGVISTSIDANNSVVGHNGAIIYTAVLYYIPELDICFSIHCNDGTKVVDLDLVFLELYNELQEYNMSVSNQDIEIPIDLTFFPNPTHDLINVHFNLSKKQEVVVVMYNSIGHRVYLDQREHMSGDHQLNINLSEMENGFYVLHIQTEEGVQTKTIIKN